MFTVLLREMLTTSYRESSVLVAGSFSVEYNKLLVTIFFVVVSQQSRFQTNQCYVTQVLEHNIVKMAC